MKKSEAECEFKAGLILGDLQNNGFGPQDVVCTLLYLSAYMIERNRRPDIPQQRAVEHFCDQLRQLVGETN